MHIFTIHFKCPLIFDYSEMIQLYTRLLIPVPTDVQAICTASTPSGTTSYANWGYAQIQALIFTGGQKYNVQLQNPGYIALKLGYFTTNTSQNSTGTTNYYYDTFNLNDYNNYVNNSNVRTFTFNYVGFNQLALAYAYVNQSGFTLDLTELQPYYAIILELVKFDYVKQFTTYQITEAGNTYIYNMYGMSTSLNNIFLAQGMSNLQLNTTNFLGISFNTNLQFSMPYNAPVGLIGYQLNYNFLVNDETVSNNAFIFPSDLSNVTGVPQNTNALIQSNGLLPSITSVIQFGEPQNITYYSFVNFSNNTTSEISAIGSETSPGLPNTNTIVASDITLPQPHVGGNNGNLKSLYNNNGYNDVWVLSTYSTTCSPNNTVYYNFPPYFNPFNLTSSSYFLQFNSSSPDIIYQYIVQAPIVQVSTTTTSTTTSSAPPTPHSYIVSSTPMTQAPSSVSSTTTQQTTTTTSSTSSITVTNVTQQIVTALANPIVALILALALVGLALFVFV